MRVLGIVCSPRKEGNTEIMVREALGAANENGAETDMFLISEKKVGPCDGCLSCEQTNIYHIKDSMHELYEKLQLADGIVFGTPVAFGNMTAQAKAIIDRTDVFRKERRLSGKVAGAIIVNRRVGAGQVRNLLCGYFVGQRMIVAGAAIGYGRKRGEVETGVGGQDHLTALEEARHLGTNVFEMVR